jgi:hypothetical protein
MTDYQAEWLETDGRGGFVSGTVGLTRSCRICTRPTWYIRTDDNGSCRSERPVAHMVVRAR